MESLRVVCCCVAVLHLLVTVWSKRIDLKSHQEQILDQHNEYRREEKASNMMYMKWNDTLAAAASSWAERCDFKHEMKSKLGENLAFDTREYETSKLLDGLMTGWHDEKRMWKYGSQSCGFACHFTQLVWHSTNTVGCAATRCPAMSGMMGSIKNAFYLVCFYYPRGNWRGQVAYIPGQACSKCDSGVSCKQDLCDVDNNAPRVAAAPAPASLALKQSKQPQSKARSIFSFSRYETFSHGTGANRKTVRRGSSILHRGGPRHLPAPQAITARRTITQGDQGTALARPNRVRQFYSKSAQTTRHRGQVRSLQTETRRHNTQRAHPQRRHNSQRSNHPNRRHHSRKSSTNQERKQQHQLSPKKNQTPSKKNGKRKKRLCRDRLPACWKWSERCGSNRAMKVMCPKSCNACDLVFSIVDKRNGRRATGRQTTEERPGNSAQQRQSHKRGHPGNRGHQSRRHHNRAGTADDRHSRHKKTNTVAQKKTQNSVLPQRDNPACRDNPSFSTRCGFWAKTGFCEQNYMMRDMYCKKTCGNC